MIRAVSVKKPHAPVAEPGRSCPCVSFVYLLRGIRVLCLANTQLNTATQTGRHYYGKDTVSGQNLA